jgi:hypothetical protein
MMTLSIEEAKYSLILAISKLRDSEFKELHANIEQTDAETVLTYLADFDSFHDEMRELLAQLFLAKKENNVLKDLLAESEKLPF